MHKERQKHSLLTFDDCSEKSFPVAKFSSRVNMEKTSLMQSMVAGTRPARSAGKAWYLLMFLNLLCYSISGCTGYRVLLWVPHLFTKGMCKGAKKCEGGEKYRCMRMGMLYMICLQMLGGENDKGCPGKLLYRAAFVLTTVLLPPLSGAACLVYPLWRV